MDYLRDVMKTVGLEPERLQMHYCSAAEGQKFQTTVKKMTHEIGRLGPNPLKKLVSVKKKTKK